MFVASVASVVEEVAEARNTPASGTPRSIPVQGPVQAKHYMESGDDDTAESLPAVTTRSNADVGLEGAGAGWDHRSTYMVRES